MQSQPRYLGREALLNRDDLILLRVWLDRVSLYHYEDGTWCEIQRAVTRDAARLLGCDEQQLKHVYEGI